MTLVGKYGTIAVDGNDCTAMISNGILKEKYGDSVKFQVDDLPKWMSRLKIVATADGRIKLGNWDF